MSSTRRRSLFYNAAEYRPQLYLAMTEQNSALAGARQIEHGGARDRLFRVAAMLMFRSFRVFCFLLLFAASAVARPLVVIDAGHGGHDRGGMPGQRVPEKNYTLDVARRLDAVLRGAGFRTVLTRRSDDFVGLGERCNIANRQSNAIFVSIHFNGASNYDAFGVETYYCRGSKSAALAAAIHRSVLAATGTMDRRVRSRGFFVIRRTNVPAVLCELGFLTNRNEAARIATTSYRQKLAEAVARGIRAQY